jgi:hypothetical protein
MNVKISDEEFEAVKEIRKLSGKTFSRLLRDSIHFHLLYYTLQHSKDELSVQ